MTVANKLVHFESSAGSMHVMDGTPYFARTLSYNRKMFMKLATAVKGCKTFFTSALTMWHNKLEGLSSLTRIFSGESNIFV